MSELFWVKGILITFCLIFFQITSISIHVGQTRVSHEQISWQEGEEPRKQKIQNHLKSSADILNSHSRVRRSKKKCNSINNPEELTLWSSIWEIERKWREKSKEQWAPRRRGLTTVVQSHPVESEPDPTRSWWLVDCSALLLPWLLFSALLLMFTLLFVPLSMDMT